MSDLTVQTSYSDISDLAEAYAQRVDDARIMLPAAQPFGDGQWIRFLVTLADGTSALEGSGRVQQTLDNGEAFPAEERYDIVLEQLQLEARAEVVFERIVLASQAGSRADPPTGEIALDQVNAIEEAAVGEEEATYAAEPASDMYADDADVEQMPSQRPPAPAAQPRPAAAARPAPAAAPPMTGLSRPSKGSQWYPDLPERPDPRPSSGYFQYGQGVLPQPGRPPRPELPEERRIRPAPKPTNGQTGASYPAARRGQDLIPTVQANVGDSTREHDVGEHAQDMDLDETSHSIENPGDDGEEV